jgi:nickel transport protein
MGKREGLRRGVPRLPAALIVFLLAGGVALHAHGTEYQLLAGGVVGVRAAFDTGQPMADAPVLVFAPGESHPELKTSTDHRGVVCFAPDRPGLWVLQVRAQGGHGMRINLQVDQSMVASPAQARQGSFSAWQKLIMAASVVWGFLGTALFFRSRRRER